MILIFLQPQHLLSLTDRKCGDLLIPLWASACSVPRQANPPRSRLQNVSKTRADLGRLVRNHADSISSLKC